MKKPVMQVLGIADFAERVTGESGESLRKNGGESCFETVEDHERSQRAEIQCRL